MQHDVAVLAPMLAGTMAARAAGSRNGSELGLVRGDQPPGGGYVGAGGTWAQPWEQGHEVQESVPVLCVGPRPGNLNASWLRLVSGTRVMYWSVLGVVVQLRPPTPRVGKCFAGVGCRGYCL